MLVLPNTLVLRVFAASLLVVALPIAAGSQSAATKPSVKLDVPYVPTPPEVVARMLDLAQVKPGQFVIDLGSGDGRIAIAAAQRGARALGVDIDPDRVIEARANAERAGVADRVRFVQQNLFDTPIGEADVLAMYLLHRINFSLRPRILREMRPGTRVVSHAFDMDTWTPEQQETVNGRAVYLWIVPARVEGTWRVENGDRRFVIDLKQEFQTVTGTQASGDATKPIANATLNGRTITFTVELDGSPITFRGEVDGDTMSGQGWRATRS